MFSETFFFPVFVYELDIKDVAKYENINISKVSRCEWMVRYKACKTKKDYIH